MKNGQMQMQRVEEKNPGNDSRETERLGAFLRELGHHKRQRDKHHGGGGVYQVSRRLVV